MTSQRGVDQDRRRPGGPKPQALHPHVLAAVDGQHRLERDRLDAGRPPPEQPVGLGDELGTVVEDRERDAAVDHRTRLRPDRDRPASAPRAGRSAATPRCTGRCRGRSRPPAPPCRASPGQSSGRRAARRSRCLLLPLHALLEGVRRRGRSCPRRTACRPASARPAARPPGRRAGSSPGGGCSRTARCSAASRSRALDDLRRSARSASGSGVAVIGSVGISSRS